MKRYTLIQALSKIAQMNNLWAGDITMIEYEDGSGFKFNYSVKNGKKQFIAL